MKQTEQNCNYGYYSKLLNKPFDTLDELKKAEDEYNHQHELEIKAREEKKADAHKVEEAYKVYLEVVEKANRDVNFAHEEYVKARQKFINKYGSYHMTYTNVDGEETFGVGNALVDLINLFR